MSGSGQQYITVHCAGEKAAAIYSQKICIRIPTTGAVYGVYVSQMQNDIL